MQSPVSLIFPTGEIRQSNYEINIGGIRALAADVREPLLSCYDLAVQGYKIILDSDGGTIINQQGAVTQLQLLRGQWMILLDDLRRLGSDSIPSQISSTFCSALVPTDSPIFDSFPTISISSITTVALSRVSIRNSVYELHTRLGHANTEDMCSAISGPTPAWSNCTLSCADIRRIMHTFVCIFCSASKRNAPTIPLPLSDNSTPLPGDVISFDPVGKISPKSASGAIYYFLFKDVATGFLHAFPSSALNSNTILPLLTTVCEFYRRYGWKPRVLRSDSAINLNSSEINQFLVANQMIPQNSAPYAHYQNSVERDVQTVTKGVSTLLHAQYWLPANRWDLALMHYIACRNATPHSNSSSPRQLVMKSSVDLHRQFLHAFGDLVLVHLPSVDKAWKFDVKNDIGIYVGHPEGTVQACYIYWPQDHSISVRTGVSKISVSTPQMLRFFGRRSSLRDSRPMELIEDAKHFFSIPVQEGESQEGAIEQDKTNSEPLRVPLFDSSDTISALPRPMPHLRTTPTSDRILRSSSSNSTAVSSVNFLGGHPQHIVPIFSVRNSTIDTPTVRSALASPSRQDWIDSIKSEMNQLFMRKTLEPVDFIPPGAKRIRSTMRLKAKRKNDNSQTLDKFKARLCARGDMLTDIVTETYSPTINSLTLALVHQLAVIDQMHMFSIDTVGAYLYQDYPTTAVPLYMNIDPLVADAMGFSRSAYFRIWKYIYGLPDAGRAYYEAYSALLIRHGYIMSPCDPCLFVKVVGSSRTYVIIFVDDTFVATTCLSEKALLLDILRSEFDLTIHDTVDEYLGIHMDTLPDLSVKLSQPKLLAALFLEFDQYIDKTHHTSNPMRRRPTDVDTAPVPVRTFLRLNGMLLYLTRAYPQYRLQFHTVLLIIKLLT